jgi:hypothetical protein
VQLVKQVQLAALEPQAFRAQVVQPDHWEPQAFRAQLDLLELKEPPVLLDRKVQQDHKVLQVLIQLCQVQQDLKELPEPEPLAQLVFRVQLA